MSEPLPMILPGRIPSLQVGPRTEERHCVLLWVHTGRATIDIIGLTLTLRTGQALWIPPGTRHCTRTAPGTVVIPLSPRPSALNGSLRDVRLVRIPSGWDRWLIHRWDDNSHTRDDLPGDEELLRLVTGRSSESTRAAPHAGSLPLPTTPEPLRIARRILEAPASDRSLESYAAQERISGRTLHRHFVRETGISGARWRARARVAIAADHLDQGRDIGWTRRQLGYTTPTGFTKAFREHMEITPSAYLRRVRGSFASRGQRPRENSADSSTDLLPAPPRVPARTLWELVGDVTVLMWMHSGTAQLRIAGHSWDLRAGEAIWIPAGLTHSIRCAEESLLLCIARVAGRADFDREDMRVLTLPREARLFLLHTMIAEFNLFRPPKGHSDFARDLLRTQLAEERPSDTSIPGGTVGVIARALRRDPADPRTLGDWAERLDLLPHQLSREFLRQTGTTFPRWRARLRMDLARTMLRAGIPPGTASRRLGYSSPATFSAAFTHSHGLSPRTYQRREARRNELTARAT